MPGESSSVVDGVKGLLMPAWAGAAECQGCGQDSGDETGEPRMDEWDEGERAHGDSLPGEPSLTHGTEVTVTMTAAPGA